LVLLVGCVEPELGVTHSDVIGGAASQPGKYPGVGALMFDMGGGTMQAGCTGTLIAPTVVLTAAHCIDPLLTGGATPGFTLALDTTTGAPVIVPGMQTIQHEMFTLDVMFEGGLSEFFDVGLVVLAQPITEVAPVPMPRPSESAELVADLDMEIVGYGVTDVSGGGGGILFDATTKLVSLNATEIQVGMGTPQPQNCNGDSGGPGFATVGGKRRVIGIVSRSFRDAECTMGGVDTRVDAYLSWIHSHLPAGTVVPCDSGLAEACAEPEPEPEPEPGPDDDDTAGCCSSSPRGAAGSFALALLVGVALLRRRRA
jgi:uncharacterized protein (TIGR03382 family)